MKKLLSLLLVLTLALTMGLTLYSCANNETPDDDDETDGETGDDGVRILSHADYLAAEDGSKVVIEAYVQAKQGWWEKDGKGVITVYLQDNAGGYFAYNLACTEENAKKLTPGTKIRVTGDKATWDGEVEIMNGTFEFCDENDTYIAPIVDVTSLMGKDGLITHMNEFVSFKKLTVAASTKKDDTNKYAFLYKWDGSGVQGDDVYFNVTDGENTYTFVVESYLCGKDTDVYKAAEALKIGDVINIEGFLYWYNGAQTHVTKISDGTKSEGVMTYDQYLAAEDGAKVVVEAYVQAKQGWWEKDGKGVISVYLQDEVGGYFAYNLACTEENAKKLTAGTKIKITGDKAVWDGEVEIMNGTFEFCDTEETLVATVTDVTSLMGTEELINHMNKFVTFKNLTVAKSTKKDDTAEYAFLYKWDGSGVQGDDLYFNLTDGTNTYSFVIESYLCGKDTDVYKAVEALKVGDKVSVEGFLYWYNGPQAHVIKLDKVTTPEAE
ncbi:MAG: hypothetical protein IJY18_04070 [Clostridia bacterium]|nr:hypothetical protein [Clostridia bacterium]